MKGLATFLVAVLFTSLAWAQSPEKMSYQAIIRNSSDQLITNQAIGIRVSILEGSLNGTAVYTETHAITTNANGLASLAIGEGMVVTGDFSTIDWGNGLYFLKTETDPDGGTNYTISGTSQLLSVPYALHAKTAETISGKITEIDPAFTSSEAANITEADISNLGNLSGVNTGDQDLSNLATNTALADSAAQLREEIQAGADGSETKVTAGTNVSVTGTGTEDSPYVINSSAGGGTGTHYLGEEYLGGIIFYLYTGNDGNQHGLIVSKTQTDAIWQNTPTLTNANRSWDGMYNTNLMTGSPAKNWIESNFSSEWYLPAIDELRLLWQNLFHVNNALNDLGATLISTFIDEIANNYPSYLSSTEVSQTVAKKFDFYRGLIIYPYSDSKDFSTGSVNKVRAIRAF